MTDGEYKSTVKALAFTITTQRLRCGHCVRYQCPKCRDCYQCNHEYREMRGVWMVRCVAVTTIGDKVVSRAPGDWKPAYPTGAAIL